MLGAQEEVVDGEVRGARGGVGRAPHSGFSLTLAGSGWVLMSHVLSGGHRPVPPCLWQTYLSPCTEFSSRAGTWVHFPGTDSARSCQSQGP